MHSLVPNLSACFPQFDADRNEDEVFYDISVAVDSKLFPNKEAAAGKSPCPLGNSVA